MKDIPFNLMLVVLIEAVSAAALYLKGCLKGNLRRSGNDDNWSNHIEFV